MLYAKVSNPKKSGEVLYDPRDVTVPQMILAIAEVGFHAELVKIGNATAATGPPKKDCGFMNAFC